jgi:hypothetical protein
VTVNKALLWATVRAWNVCVVVLRLAEILWAAIAIAISGK